MLRFFRQIRQRLLTDNKFGKYLLYAVGEILLVVIGILIALQVDNWNEERKLKKEEFLILAELKADLEETLNDLQFGKSLNESTIENYRTILSAIENDEPHSNEIDKACFFINAFYVPSFRRTTYETLKSETKILSNDSLKRKISDLYDSRFTYLTEDQLKIEWAIYNQQTLLYGNKYLRYKDSDVPAVYPVDFERMKSDSGFINYLSSLIGFRKYGIGVYSSTIEAIQEVIISIEREMKEMNI
jgi:hypothetical protein